MEHGHDSIDGNNLLPSRGLILSTNITILVMAIIALCSKICKIDQPPTSPLQGLQKLFSMNYTFLARTLV